MHKVKIPKRNENAQRVENFKNKYITKEEYRLLINECDSLGCQSRKDFIAWLYHTGMRFGKAAALRPSDIFQGKDGYWYYQVNGSLIHRVNVTIDKRFSKSKSAKSLAGNRTILLSKELVDIYQRNKDNICSIPIDGDNHLLFVNHFRGKNLPIGKVSFEQFIQKCAKRAGIEKHLTAHAFRHTHITNLIIQKVDLKTVMNRAGHKDASTTLAIYTHVTAQQ